MVQPEVNLFYISIYQLFFKTFLSTKHQLNLVITSCHFLANVEIPFNEISVKPEQEPAPEVVELGEGLKGISVDLLLKPIEELELSVRAHNCLINAGVKRVIDLVNLADDDVLKIKNFGRKSLNEVKDSMKAFNLSFGMDIKEDDIKKVLKSREE